MAYPRHPTIDHYLNKVRLHTEPYSAVVLGKDITIFPLVMSPKYDRSSQIFISMMPSQLGKSFLEIGTGCGIVSVFAAANGARTIVATDINPHAIENAKKNFVAHNMSHAEVFYSDLFQNVRGAFDTIFFNAPFHGNTPTDILEYGTSDENYQTLTRFFRDAHDHLNPDGEILLGFSNTGDFKLLESLITNNYFKINDFKTRENGDWTAYFYSIKKR